MLRQFIYMSTSMTLLRDWELEQIGEVARRNNARGGVTGMLLYADGSFLHLLEGEYLAVEEVMERISRDHRHTRITPLIDHWVQKREFGEDPLNVRCLTEQEVDELTGVKRFFSTPSGAAARKALTSLRHAEEPALA